MSQFLCFGDIVCFKADLLKAYISGHFSPLEAINDVHGLSEVVYGEVPDKVSVQGTKQELPANCENYFFQLLPKLDYESETSHLQILSHASKLNIDLEDELPAATDEVDLSVSKFQCLPCIHAGQKQSSTTAGDIEMVGDQKGRGRQRRGSLASTLAAVSEGASAEDIILTPGQRRAFVKQLKESKKKAAQEANRNNQKIAQSNGEAIYYGDIVQLRHVQTGMLLCAKTTAGATVTLVEVGSTGCNFHLDPAYKWAARGEAIQFNNLRVDHVNVCLLCSDPIFGGKTYITARPEERSTNAAGFQLPGLAHKLALDGVARPNECVEVCTGSDSANQHRFEMYLSGSSKSQNSDSLTLGRFVRLFHRESEAFIALFDKTPAGVQNSVTTKLVAAMAEEDCRATKGAFAVSPTVFRFIDGDGSLTGALESIALDESEFFIQHVVSGLFLCFVYSSSKEPEFIEDDTAIDADLGFSAEDRLPATLLALSEGQVRAAQANGYSVAIKWTASSVDVAINGANPQKDVQITSNSMFALRAVASDTEPLWLTTTSARSTDGGSKVSSVIASTILGDGDHESKLSDGGQSFFDWAAIQKRLKFFQPMETVDQTVLFNVEFVTDKVKEKIEHSTLPLSVLQNFATLLASSLEKAHQDEREAEESATKRAASSLKKSAMSKLKSFAKNVSVAQSFVDSMSSEDEDIAPKKELPPQLQALEDACRPIDGLALQLQFSVLLEFLNTRQLGRMESACIAVKQICTKDAFEAHEIHQAKLLQMFPDHSMQLLCGGLRVFETIVVLMDLLSQICGWGSKYGPQGGYISQPDLIEKMYALGKELYYVARFAVRNCPSNQTQFGVDAGGIHLMVSHLNEELFAALALEETVRNNKKLITSLQENILDVVWQRAATQHRPRFVKFLSSLLVCNGLPVARMQQRMLRFAQGSYKMTANSKLNKLPPLFPKIKVLPDSGQMTVEVSLDVDNVHQPFKMSDETLLEEQGLMDQDPTDASDVQIHARFAIRCLELICNICIDRNRDALSFFIENDFGILPSRSDLISAISSSRVPFAMRAVFVKLLQTFYIDREPMHVVITPRMYRSLDPELDNLFSQAELPTQQSIENISDCTECISSGIGEVVQIGDSLLDPQFTDKSEFAGCLLRAMAQLLNFGVIQREVCNGSPSQGTLKLLDSFNLVLSTVTTSLSIPENASAHDMQQVEEFVELPTSQNLLEAILKILHYLFDLRLESRIRLICKQIWADQHTVPSTWFQRHFERSKVDSKGGVNAKLLAQSLFPAVPSGCIENAMSIAETSLAASLKKMLLCPGNKVRYDALSLLFRHFTQKGSLLHHLEGISLLHTDEEVDQVIRMYQCKADIRTGLLALRRIAGRTKAAIVADNLWNPKEGAVHDESTIGGFCRVWLALEQLIFMIKGQISVSSCESIRRQLPEDMLAALEAESSKQASSESLENLNQSDAQRNMYLIDVWSRIKQILSIEYPPKHADLTYMRPIMQLTLEFVKGFVDDCPQNQQVVYESISLFLGMLESNTRIANPSMQLDVASTVIEIFEKNIKLTRQVSGDTIASLVNLISKYRNARWCKLLDVFMVQRSLEDNAEENIEENQELIAEHLLDMLNEPAPSSALQTDWRNPSALLRMANEQGDHLAQFGSLIKFHAQFFKTLSSCSCNASLTLKQSIEERIDTEAIVYKFEKLCNTFFEIEVWDNTSVHQSSSVNDSEIEDAGIQAELRSAPLYSRCRTAPEIPHILALSYIQYMNSLHLDIGRHSSGDDGLSEEFKGWYPSAEEGLSVPNGFLLHVAGLLEHFNLFMGNPKAIQSAVFNIGQKLFKRLGSKMHFIENDHVPPVVLDEKVNLDWQGSEPDTGIDDWVLNQGSTPRLLSVAASRTAAHLIGTFGVVVDIDMADFATQVLDAATDSLQQMQVCCALVLPEALARVYCMSGIPQTQDHLQTTALLEREVCKIKDSITQRDPLWTMLCPSECWDEGRKMHAALEFLTKIHEELHACNQQESGQIPNFGIFKPLLAENICNTILDDIQAGNLQEAKPGDIGIDSGDVFIAESNTANVAMQRQSQRLSDLFDQTVTKFQDVLNVDPGAGLQGQGLRDLAEFVLGRGVQSSSQNVLSTGLRTGFSAATSLASGMAGLAAAAASSALDQVGAGGLFGGEKSDSKLELDEDLKTIINVVYEISGNVSISGVSSAELSEFIISSLQLLRAALYLKGDHLAGTADVQWLRYKNGESPFVPEQDSSEMFAFMRQVQTAFFSRPRFVPALSLIMNSSKLSDHCKIAAVRLLRASTEMCNCESLDLIIKDEEQVCSHSNDFVLAFVNQLQKFHLGEQRRLIELNKLLKEPEMKEFWDANDLCEYLVCTPRTELKNPIEKEALTVVEIDTGFLATERILEAIQNLCTYSIDETRQHQHDDFQGFMVSQPDADTTVVEDISLVIENVANTISLRLRDVDGFSLQILKESFVSLRKMLFGQHPAVRAKLLRTSFFEFINSTVFNLNLRKVSQHQQINNLVSEIIVNMLMLCRALIGNDADGTASKKLAQNIAWSDLISFIVSLESDHDQNHEALDQRRVQLYMLTESIKRNLPDQGKGISQFGIIQTDPNMADVASEVAHHVRCVEITRTGDPELLFFNVPQVCEDTSVSKSKLIKFDDTPQGTLKKFILQCEKNLQAITRQQKAGRILNAISYAPFAFGFLTNVLLMLFYKPVQLEGTDVEEEGEPTYFLPIGKFSWNSVPDVYSLIPVSLDKKGAPEIINLLYVIFGGLTVLFSAIALAVYLIFKARDKAFFAKLSGEMESGSKKSLQQISAECKQIKIIDLIKQPQFWWRVFICGGAAGGFFYTPLLFTLVLAELFTWPSMSLTFQTFRVKGKEFAALFALLVLVVYMNAIIGFLFFWNRHVDVDNICSTLFQCIAAYVREGIMGDGIADILNAPSDVDGYPTAIWEDWFLWIRVVWDLFFFLGVVVILLSIVTGLIIDSFSDLRSEKQEIEDKKESSCYICSISAVDFREAKSSGVGSSFEHHCGHEHNVMDYFFLYVRLRNESADNLTAQEQFVLDSFDRMDVSAFPIGKSLSLLQGGRTDEEDEPKQEGMTQVERDDALKQLTEITQVMAKQLASMASSSASMQDSTPFGRMARMPSFHSPR